MLLRLYSNSNTVYSLTALTKVTSQGRIPGWTRVKNQVQVLVAAHSLSNDVSLVSVALQVLGHQGEVGEEASGFLRPQNAVLKVDRNISAFRTAVS